MDPSGIRLIESSDTDPFYNIALADALHLAAEEGGEPVIRFWRCRKAVVLGNARKVGEDVFLGNCLTDGIPVIRRHTGGGTVYLHPEVLNFTLVLPYIHPALKPKSRIRESIRFLLQPLLESLKQVGLAVDIKNDGDIFLCGRKVGGNAQARKKRTLLHHGSLMIDDRVGEMSRFLRVPPERAGIPHPDFVTCLKREDYHFDEEVILKYAVEGWTNALGLGKTTPDAITTAEKQTALDLVEAKYSKEDHNLKR